MAMCLVTGGAGFVGSHLVDTLVAGGHAVRAIDDFSTGKRENLSLDKCELISGSITDVNILRSALQDCECVFHLAARPSVQRSIEDPMSTHSACATATLQLLVCCRDSSVRRIVYASSGSVYGDAVGDLRSETDPVAPSSPYAVAKLAGEHYCRCFTKAFGLETVSLRFFNVFGPRQSADSPYSGVIPRFIRAASSGGQPTVFGDGLQSRDFTFVDNAVQALVKAASAPEAAGNVYNVGTGVRTSVLQLAKMIGETLGRDAQPTFAPARLGEVRHSRADISLARKELGYEPTVSVLEGLQRTVRGFQDWAEGA